MSHTANSESEADASIVAVDDVTRRLFAWLIETAPGLRYVDELPGPDDTPSVQVSLVQVRPGNPPSSPATPLELQLDYLCVGSSAKAPAVQRAFGEIAFAALASGTYAVSTAQSGPLGLLLTARLIRHRRLVRGPRVRSRVYSELRPLTNLFGILLGPDKIALPGASVRTAARNSGVTHTGPDGRFTLSADVEPGRQVMLDIGFNGRQLSAYGVAGTTETAFLVKTEE